MLNKLYETLIATTFGGFVIGWIVDALAHSLVVKILGAVGLAGVSAGAVGAVVGLIVGGILFAATRGKIANDDDDGNEKKNDAEDEAPVTKSDKDDSKPTNSGKLGGSTRK
ncbi:MAG: hypothetical protein GC134_00370 [Proteobacteria bacterium]|nr:hypothetical protein [Pseudomonadota bacterium]